MKPDAHATTTTATTVSETGQFDLKKYLWPLIGLMLIGYGLIALNAGFKVSPWLGARTASPEQVETIIRSAETGQNEPGTELANQVLPAWLNLVASLGSEKYAYSSESITATEKHYLGMPKKNQATLSIHMMAGLFIMVFGAFQFWPAFRKKHRTLHRISGALYLLAAMVSLSMSSYYLFLTDVTDIYSQWVFETGLAALVIIATGSLLFAGVAIFKRQIAWHLGWQAIAFGAFLTAPIQRIYWLAFAPLAGESTFNEMNIIINVSLIGQAFLASYLIFLMNRHASPLRASADKPAEAAGQNPLLSGLLVTTLAIGIACTAFVYLGGNGLGEFGWTASAMMPSSAQWHDQILDSATAPVFGLLTAVFVTIAAFIAFGNPANRQSTKLWLGLLLSGLAICAIEANWAIQLGKPSDAHSLGGTFYGYAGITLFGFLVSSVWQHLANRQELSIELLRFALMLALAPALSWITLILGAASGFVPQQYTEIGQGYQFATGVALALPMIIGVVTAIHSSYTRRFGIS